jgi:hypothetical protein
MAAAGESQWNQLRLPIVIKNLAGNLPGSHRSRQPTSTEGNKDTEGKSDVVGESQDLPAGLN